MEIKKQDNQERVLAYQEATVLAYDEMEQISGGSGGRYWTLFQTFAPSSPSGSVPEMRLDGRWD